jgi:two-component system cell cycle response regulator DivK
MSQKGPVLARSTQPRAADRRARQSKWPQLTFYRVKPEGPFHMPSRSSSVGRSATRRTPRPATAQPTLLPCVLLVDDNADNREMYRQYLEWDGFRVVMATDGLQALDQATRVMPTVIVTDLAMPRLNGWDMVGRLKGDPRTQHVPVLAISAHALVGESTRALAAGCDGYVSKPCLPEELARAIRTLIQRQSGTPSRSAPAERPARRPTLP